MKLPSAFLSCSLSFLHCSFLVVSWLPWEGCPQGGKNPNWQMPPSYKMRVFLQRASPFSHIATFCSILSATEASSFLRRFNFHKEIACWWIPRSPKSQCVWWGWCGRSAKPPALPSGSLPHTAFPQWQSQMCALINPLPDPNFSPTVGEEKSRRVLGVP